MGFAVSGFGFRVSGLGLSTFGSEDDEGTEVCGSHGDNALAHVGQQVVHRLLANAKPAAGLVLVVIAHERLDASGENNGPGGSVAVDEGVQTLVHPVPAQNVTIMQWGMVWAYMSGFSVPPHC